jgi:hypothetical protein
MQSFSVQMEPGSYLRAEAMSGHDAEVNHRDAGNNSRGSRKGDLNRCLAACSQEFEWVLLCEMAPLVGFSSPALSL